MSDSNVCKHGYVDPWNPPGCIECHRQRIAELERDVARLREVREAALAFQALTVIYRTNGRPTEKLMARLDKARKTLEDNDE